MSVRFVDICQHVGDQARRKLSLLPYRSQLPPSRRQTLCCSPRAGMGVDLGLADFRSEVSQARVVRQRHCARGLNFHQLDSYRRAEPHGGYRVLHKLAQIKGPDVHFRWTIKVDGVFHSAGFSYDHVRGALMHPQIAVLERAGAQGSGRTRDGRVGGGGGDAARADLPLIE